MSRFVLTAQLQLQAPNNVAQVVRQIQSQLNNVSVNIQVQGAAQAQRQIQQIANQTNQATTAAERMGKAFAVSVRRFAAFSIATRAVGLFTSTLSDAVQTAIDFEREMIRVSQVTGESVGKLKFLTSAITELSTGLGVSSKDLLQTSQLLLQAGISAKDTEVALKTLAKAALAPNFDSLSETTEGAIAILAQFQEGVGSLEKQLGSINAVAGAFAVEAGDLIDVIRRTGGVFKSSGGSLNELLALFTSVRATTRESAESIGTGLRTIFTRIQRPKTIEFLKQFGVELVDLEGKFVGPFEAVKRLSAALSGLGEGDLTFIRIAEELGGFRQIGKVLPLLQQFSTAQNALNVANKAGNSLTNDAATAQQALAIRIIKVKEEFLALVRSITETSTFQVMANTALSLASALIKLADSIKPLLPLLGAMAAVKIVKGLGGFLGGAGAGLTSGRTFNKGGKVHHFARGGMVPGTGNRDTVPAMLQPGEFVIKKSSVNQLGAGNLAAMNENRYATGGPMTTAQKLAAARADKTISANPNKTKNTKYTSGRDKDELRFSVQDGNIGAFFMNKEGTPDGLKKFQSKSFNITNSKLLSLAGIKPYKTKGDRMAGKPDTFSAKGILESGNIQTFYPSIGDIKSGSLSQIVQNNVKNKLSEAVISVANDISSKKLLDIPPIDSNDALLSNAAKRIQSDSGAIRTTSGYLFEGVIDALTGAKPASGNAVFDFPASSLQGNRKKLAALFGNESAISKLKQADAKASYSSKIIDGDMGSGSISSKIINSINNGVLAGIKIQKKNLGGIIQKFATGGGVGTDTVPALLTPGEFVVNRSSAQSIGYGNLNRMNKVGKYAKGGVVQKFATGTSGSGVKSGDTLGARVSGFNPKVFVALEKTVFSLMDVFRGVGRESQKTIAAFQSISITSPALVDSIRSNSIANNRTKTMQEKVAIAFDKLIYDMLMQGVSSDQVEDAAKRYVAALDKDTKAKLASSTATPAPSTATPAPSTATPAPSTRPPQSGGGSTSSGSGSSTTRNTAAVNANTKAQQGAARSAMDVVSNNKMFAASMATSLIAGFLPAIDENSGALLKLSHSFLGMIMTIASVGFALEAFGVQLKSQAIMDFFSGRSFPGAGKISNIFNTITDKMGNFGRVLRASTQAAARGGNGMAAGATAGIRAGYGGQAAGLAAKFGTSLGTAAGAVAKFAGPVLAAVAATYLIIKASNALVSAFYDVSAKLEASIKAGNITETEKLAGQQYDVEAANSTRAVMGSIGAVAGGAIGAYFGGPFGLVVGAAIGSALGTITGTILANLSPQLAEGINILFGGNTKDSFVKFSAAQAGAIKTQKALEEAQKTASSAMDELSKGSISAAEALAKVRSATSEAVSQEQRSSDAAMSNLQNRSEYGSGKIARNLGAYLGGGLFGMETAATRNERLGKESASQINQAAKFQTEAFQIESPARSAMIRSGLVRGRSSEDIRSDAVGGLQQRRLDLLKKAGQAGMAGDTESEKAFRAAAQQMEEQMQQVEKEMANLEKEVARAKAAFDAMNLGLRGPTATATAMSASMTRFAAGLEVGGNMFVANTEFLSEAVSGAAQAMDPNEIKSAMSGVKKSLEGMGLSPAYAAKFEANTQAFIQAQQNYNQAFANIKDRIKGADFTGMSADKLKEEFAKELTVGLGDDAKKNLTAIIEGMQLSEGEVDQILSGNLQVFGDKLGEAGKKQFEEIMKIAQERQKAEQVLIDLTKKRIDAERNAIEAQKEAIDLAMEGREIQGKYGGAAVTNTERRAAVVAKANAGASRLGLSEMRDGSIGDLRRRRQEIGAGFASIEGKRTVEGGMQGVKGVTDNETQADLQKAQKDQVQTIRDLIKLEEDELRIISEKNKLEKQSLESLISGDIDKFFEQQAAVGAQAALATGDQRLIRQFGGNAVGAAFSDLQRQSDAGVQSLYGQNMGGPGGLLERAGSAALASRGVQNPMATQVLAGTTGAEEASKARLRELGGELGATGELGAQMAEMQVQTASINVANAEIKMQDIEERGRAATEAAAGMRRGGIVYASRGIFVPKGTDTVPAMLTPGEFVVNRAAVNRGNNLQVLQSMNRGISNSSAAATGTQSLSRGGKVKYLQTGGQIGSGSGSGVSISPEVVNNLTKALEGFNAQLANNIRDLQNTKFKIALDTTNVNVNLTGGAFLASLKDSIKKELLSEVSKQINNMSVGQNGKLVNNSSTLPK